MRLGPLPPDTRWHVTGRETYLAGQTVNEVSQEAHTRLELG
jgi:hypothetical protein